MYNYKIIKNIDVDDNFTQVGRCLCHENKFNEEQMKNMINDIKQNMINRHENYNIHYLCRELCTKYGFILMSLELCINIDE